MTSSFTLSMPPATLTSLIPKSLCRKVVSAGRPEHVPGDGYARRDRMAAGHAVQRQIPVEGDLELPLSAPGDGRLGLGTGIGDLGVPGGFQHLIVHGALDLAAVLVADLIVERERGSLNRDRDRRGAGRRRVERRLAGEAADREARIVPHRGERPAGKRAGGEPAGARIDPVAHGCAHIARNLRYFSTSGTAADRRSAGRT